jgi:hypothetical protein
MSFNLEKTLRRVELVQRLIDGATIEGERNAATLAMQRLISQARLDASLVEYQEFLLQLDGFEKSPPISVTQKDDEEFIKSVREQMMEAIAIAIEIREKFEKENNISNVQNSTVVADEMIRNQSEISQEDWLIKLREEKEYAVKMAHQMKEKMSKNARNRVIP